MMARYLHSPICAPIKTGRWVKGASCLAVLPAPGMATNTGRKTVAHHPPFTEKVPTYRLALEDGQLLIDPVANPAGTYVEPIVLAEHEEMKS